MNRKTISSATNKQRVIKMNSVELNIKKNLHKKIQGLRQTTIEDCDFILSFCFIVSRAGTDINAALDELISHQVFKPVILVVLHHTFDTEKMIPDSNTTVNSEQIFAVDCLFNEDDGLLRCQKNEDAVDKIARHLNPKKLTLYACFKDQHTENLADQDAENIPLICSGEGIQCCNCQNLCNWMYQKFLQYCTCAACTNE